MRRDKEQALEATPSGTGRFPLHKWRPSGKPYADRRGNFLPARASSSSGATGLSGRRKPCAAVIGLAHYGDLESLRLYHSLHRSKDGLTGPPIPTERERTSQGDSRWPTCRPVGDGCSWTGLRLLLLPHPILIIVIIIIITVFAFASHFHLSGNEGKVGCSQCSISRVNLFARVALQEGNVELVGERYLTE